MLSDDSILLLADSDPGVPGSGWWVTPGGGIDDGEDAREAAAREAHEETGLPVRIDDVEGPVAVRVVVHGYSDRILCQHETFFRARVERFDPEPVAWSDRERERLQGFRWWPTAELPEPLWPATLRTLIDWEGAGALDLGTMDESPVPLTAQDRERVSDYLRGVGFFRNP